MRNEFHQQRAINYTLAEIKHYETHAIEKGHEKRTSMFPLNTSPIMFGEDMATKKRCTRKKKRYSSVVKLNGKY